MVVNKLRKSTLFFFMITLILFVQAVTQANAQELKTIESVEALIRAAEDGGAYQILSGRYELEDTLLIERDFSLYGAGMDSTTIVTKAEFLGLSVQGDISVSFEDITFKHEGDLQEDVVEIKDAQFSIRSCKFTGGVWQEVEEGAEFVYGAGLWLHGTAKGEIFDSQFIDNDANGINISGEVELRLEQSSVSNNGWEGMLILGESKVFANALFSVDNQQEGIALNANSYLNLTDGLIESNQGGGIWLYGSSSADISDTLFRENKTYAGVGLTQDTSARVRESNFYNHEVSSFYAFGNATATVANNRIQGNEIGITVSDDAKAEISGNTILANMDAINLFDRASVMIVDNEFSDVIEGGINLNDMSYASIRDNSFVGEGTPEEDTSGDNEEESETPNTLTLIASYDSASSYITNNTFDYTNIRISHVYIDDTSQSTIVDNSFTENNQNSAIDVNGDARATIWDNIISSNVYGLVVRGEAVATVSKNIFEYNNYSILAYSDAKVIADNNILDNDSKSSIALREEAQVWLRDTSIHHAGEAAVDARDSSRAGLFNNDFSYSSSFGVYSTDKSVTYANKNFIGENVLSGFYASQNSSVAVIDNVFDYHYDFGLEFADKAKGSVVYNYFSNNNIAFGFREGNTLNFDENGFEGNSTDISRIK